MLRGKRYEDEYKVTQVYKWQFLGSVVECFFGDSNSEVFVRH